MLVGYEGEGSLAGITASSRPHIKGMRRLMSLVSLGSLRLAYLTEEHRVLSLLLNGAPGGGRGGGGTHRNT